MILLDSNVIIYAFTPTSPLRGWARSVISGAVANDGACVNPVTVAEVAVGDSDPPSLPRRIRAWGVSIVDLPAAAAEPCAEAYARYLENRARHAAAPPAKTPLPDFFIGAHAMVMEWELATADHNRLRRYFPTLTLRTPG